MRSQPNFNTNIAESGLPTCTEWPDCTVSAAGIATFATAFPKVVAAQLLSLSAFTPVTLRPALSSIYIHAIPPMTSARNSSSCISLTLPSLQIYIYKLPNLKSDAENVDVFFHTFEAHYFEKSFNDE